MEISHSLRRLAVRLLPASTVALYVSSIVYRATLLGFSINTSRFLVNTVDQLGNSSVSVVRTSMGLSDAARACILTAAFTVNVCIGDAVVWSRRARTLYPGNKKIQQVCYILLASTFVLGIVSTRRPVFVEDHGGPGSILIVYNGDAFGSAVIALSLATNVFSTALIGYKTWQHRQFLREHLGARGSKTQVLKIMALLVESGMIYCAVWADSEFLVYHLFNDMMPDINSGPWRAGSFYHEACVGPIIAIYPMGIVVLVALNQSQLEHGLACTLVGPARSATVSTIHGPGGSLLSSGATRDAQARVDCLDSDIGGARGYSELFAGQLDSKVEAEREQEPERNADAKAAAVV